MLKRIFLIWLLVITLWMPSMLVAGQVGIFIANNLHSGGGGGGTATYVSANAKTCYTATSCAWANNATTGHLLIVGASWQDNTSDPTLASTGSVCPSWSSIAVLHSTYDVVSSKIFYCTAAATGAVTPTLTGCGPDCGLTDNEFSTTSSWGTASPFTNVAGNGAPVAPNISITLSASNSVVLIRVSDEAAGSDCSGSVSPFTIDGVESSHYATSWYDVAATPTTYTPSFTGCAVSKSWITQAIAIKVN